MTDEVDWSSDRWAERLEKSIRAAAGPNMTVEVRRVNPRMALVWADPGKSAGAPLEIVVGADALQVFVADVLNAEFARPSGEHEVDAMVRGVTQHGCRLIRSGIRRYLEIGRHRADDSLKPFHIEREWTAWGAPAPSPEPESPLVYRI